MIWRTLFLIVLILGAMAAAKARAADCPGNPNAIGTSRVMTIDPHDMPRVGTVQYKQSLPLEDKEVVLTFDDGPLPPYTNRILDVLAEHCVKANYFIVGRMARGYPDLVRRIAAEGHTIGTHSENHLLGFDHAPIETVKAEIEQGIVSVNAITGGRTAANAFFRIPGFLRRQEVETYLQSRRLMTWSADVVADDWRHINAFEVVRRAISRLDDKGKGILLLHDIQPATALALPELLRQLRVKGYRIVQVVPRGIQQSVPVAEAPPTTVKQVATSGFIAVPAFPARTPATVVDSAPPRAATVAAIPAAAPSIGERPSPPMAASAVDEELTEEIQQPVLPASAANSLARGHDIPRDPVRPFTSGSKPARNMPTPGKFLTTEPGGWPPTVSVPVARAGGIGVSSPPSSSRTADGRFQ